MAPVRVLRWRRYRWKCRRQAIAIPLGVQAPGVARSVVAEWLADQVAPYVVESALLLVSELVTNSVRHSGVPEGEDVVVRVDLWRDGCRLEVEDPGRDGVIAPRPQDPLEGGGMGLNLVQMPQRALGHRARRRRADPRVGAVATHRRARMSGGTRGEEADPCRD
jgi:hypothetical protein